jgi:hypothetical protein
MKIGLILLLPSFDCMCVNTISLLKTKQVLIKAQALSMKHATCRTGTTLERRRQRYSFIRTTVRNMPDIVTGEFQPNKRWQQ